MAYGQGNETGGYVVQHDAGAAVEAFQVADGWWLGDVEKTEEQEGQQGVGPVGRDGDEGEDLAGYLVDDDVAGVFAAGLAGYDRRGWDADGCGCEGGDERAYGLVQRARVQQVDRAEPEDGCGDGAVGAGAGLHEAGSEEGSYCPCPEGLFALEGAEVHRRLLCH